MTGDPASPYPFLTPTPSLPIVFAQPPGELAQQLADLFNKALAAADHWTTLRDYDRSIQCHQAAALYASACMAAYANGM